jgi:periplasmic divalent cation tolerance protein
MPTKEDAEKTALTILEKRLAACVQIIGPIASMYRWKGNIETAQEWQCLIKSRKDLFGNLVESITADHPYETPEIIATAISAGSGDYLKWLQDELKTTGR